MNKDFELIEKYCRNELHGKELQDFQKRLSLDSALHTETEAYRQAKATIETLSQERMKRKLDATGFNKFENLRANKSEALILRKVLSIAASVVAIITAGYLLYDYWSASVKPLDLYSQYFKVPDIEDFTVRGPLSNENLSDNFQTAIDNYRKGNFQMARRNFESLLSDSTFSQPSAARLYLGICYLMLDEYNTALGSFSKVSNGSAFIQQAQWYEGLTFLKQGNAQKAVNQFQIIAGQNNHYKQEEANAILKKLKDQ